MNDLQIIGLTYLITLNITGISVAYADKQKAKQAKWRTPEKQFLLLSGLGGGVGVFIGFLAFRHKTRHFGLMAGVIALTVLFYGALTAVLFLLL